MVRPDKLIVAPLVEPVSLEEIKNYARISYNNDDEFLGELIVGAREWCEAFTGRAFITQTRQVALSAMPKRREVSFARGPLQDVLQVSVYDCEGVVTDFDVSNLIVDNASTSGRAILHDNAVWPVMQRAANGMVIDYVAGYGGAGADVPGPIKLAIKQLVAHWYENRDLLCNDNFTSRTPLTVEVLLQSYRVFRMGGSCG